MRSFVLLGSMLQSSSLVKADCTLQDGTVQIGARKLSEFPQKHPFPPKPLPEPTQKSIIFTLILNSTSNFTPTSNFYPRLIPEFLPGTDPNAFSTSFSVRKETISSFRDKLRCLMTFLSFLRLWIHINHNEGLQLRHIVSPFNCRKSPNRLQQV